MKVLHLQYRSTSSGNYTITLHDLMTSHGIDSSVLSLSSNFTPTDKKIEYFGKLRTYIAGYDYKIQEFLNRKNKKHLGGFTYPIFGTDISNHHLVKNADVIYIHWILYGFLNIKNLRQLAKLGKPMVFVLHDMWFFTGGCHHSLECNKFMTECRDCQILNPSKLVDRSNTLFNKKLKFFSEFDNLYFIAPSIWIKKKAEASTLLKGKNVFQIYNSVSSNFQRLNGTILQDEKNINKKKKIIGFGANSINSPYKGFQFFLSALKLLGKSNTANDFEVLVFGTDFPERLKQEIPFTVQITGFLTSETDICKAYNSMDVFVVSSVADNLPTTVIECLQCGIPVVGFTTGGIPEMIVHKKNGYLANKYDVNDLCKGIKYCVQNKLVGFLKKEFAPAEIVAHHLNTLAKISQKLGKI